VGSAEARTIGRMIPYHRGQIVHQQRYRPSYSNKKLRYQIQ